MSGNNEKSVIYKPKKDYSEETKSGDTLLLDW
jgi:hypothetical protein